MKKEPEKKKICINALYCTENRSGIGILSEKLFGAYVQRTDRYAEVILPKDGVSFSVPKNGRIIKAPVKSGQNILRTVFQCFFMGIKHCRNSILVTTDSKIPLILPRSCTVVPIVTDMALISMPEAYKRSRVFLWKRQYRVLKKHTNKYIAISEFTKKELCEKFGVEKERIKVIPCDAAEKYRRISDTDVLTRIRKKYSLPDKYILFVGCFNPRKNIETILRAFDTVKARNTTDIKLVIVGEAGWKLDMKTAMQGMKYSEDVILTGYVDEEDMPAVYSMAAVFAFPSLYEGFGIPIIEAQRCEVPVVTGNCTAMPDTAGAAAVLVEPRSAQAVADGVLRILSDDAFADSLRRAGIINAQRFSWEHSAELLREYIEEI